MRRKVAALTLIVAGLLTGCQWQNRSYARVSPHAEAYVQTDPAEVETASGYQELYDLLVRLIEGGAAGAVVDVSQYGDGLEQDVERAVGNVRMNDPLTAYAVGDLKIDTAEVGVRTIATVTIAYSKTNAQLRSIQSVWGYEGILTKVKSALDNGENSLTLRVTAYQSLDLEKLVKDYYQENPDRVMECPRVEVKTYPEYGANRIMEIRFHYTNSQQTLQQMAREVQVMLSSASGYVRGQETELAKAERLSFFLQPLISQGGTSATPVYSVLYEGTGDSSAVATVFDLLCRKVGLESRVVTGTRDGAEHCWNLLRLDGTWYHLDLPMSWALGEFHLAFDDEMTAYVWDDTYPWCPRPEPPDQTDTTDPVEPEPGETGTQTSPPETEPEPTDPPETEPTESSEPTEPEPTEPTEPEETVP